MEVNPNPSSKGLRWNTKMAEEARNKLTFIKVGDKVSYLHLTGAPVRWLKPEYADDIYLLDKRVAGNPTTVAQVLINNGVAAEDVNESFQNNAITALNWNVSEEDGGMAEAYKKEVEEYKKLRESVNDEAASQELVGKLHYYYANLSQAVIKGSKRLGGSGSAPKGSPKGPKVPLAQRLATLVSGKVLDVSQMKPNGTNIITIDQPGRTSKKIGVSGLAIVSSNTANYVAAVRMLGPSYEHFIQSYYVTLAANNQTAPAPTKALPTKVTKPAVSASVTHAPAPSKPAVKPAVAAAPKAGVKMPKLNTLLKSGMTVGSPVAAKS